MEEPNIPYTIEESIIKDGSILSEMKDTHYWPVLKDLIESEIRACFRAFLQETDAKMDADGQMREVAMTDDDLKAYRARAMGAKNILEMIDGKIADMEVWVATQQKESEKDQQKVQEIFAHHRSRQQAEVV